MTLSAGMALALSVRAWVEVRPRLRPARGQALARRHDIDRVRSSPLRFDKPVRAR
jgi:hypothetical protein